MGIALRDVKLYVAGAIRCKNEANQWEAEGDLVADESAIPCFDGARNKYCIDFQQPLLTPGFESWAAVRVYFDVKDSSKYHNLEVRDLNTYPGRLVCFESDDVDLKDVTPDDVDIPVLRFTPSEIPTASPVDFAVAVEAEESGSETDLDASAGDA